MNLYELIAANTAALEANTKAILAAGKSSGSTSTAAAATTDKPAATTGKGSTKAPAKPKGPSREETVAALTELKDKLGAAVAKELIAENSSVTKMADIPDGELEAVFKAAQAKLAGGEDTETAGDDGL